MILNAITFIWQDVGKEAEQYGDDVKNLGTVMKCNKKFEPWLLKNEKRIQEKIDLGTSLDVAKTELDNINLWKTESFDMKAVLDKGNTAAQLMSSHEVGKCNLNSVFKIDCGSWFIMVFSTKHK